MHILRNFIASLSLLAAAASFAAAPSGYYSSCENKGANDLLQALYETVGSHTVVSYDGLKTLYKTSDVKPNGLLWDMYSTKEWSPTSQQCGNYKNVGDCWNREHSFPKSWFNDAKPMYSDAFHLYPTDGKVNGQRSNFPYGECANGTTLPANGSVKALGRLGTSTFSGYTGKVFEPVDEYKGDFARSYFYMAAAYNNRIASWNSDMLAGNSYPAFSSWAINLLLKWHRMDPVSQKELDRNEAVYAAQHNRNPFIDHPEMVEYIWGDKKTEKWTSTAGADPTISSPVDGSTVDLGVAAVGIARTVSVTVKGTALTDNVSVAVSGSGYSVSTSSLTASQVNSANGATVNVTLNAATTGKADGMLTLKSDKLTTTVNLTATAMDGLPAAPPTNITDVSFVAHWTYVGNADKNNCYLLTVKDTDGNDVDTYPRSVPAAAEEYLVDELLPETQYSYYVECNILRSNTINVTTTAPIPSVQILYDGDLYLSAEPGTASEPAELLLDIENIDTDLTFSVNAPFQLSSDKSDWNTTLTVDPREDRIYIRLLSQSIGVFTSSIKVTAGDYYSDDAEVNGQVADAVTFHEDFEASYTGNYDTSSYTGSAAEWALTDAGVFALAKEACNGTNYLRMGKSVGSIATMTTDKRGGIGIVTLQASGWSASDGAAEFDLDYSTDGGETWQTAGSGKIAKPASSTKVYSEYTFTVNQAGDVRLRLRQTYGQRFCVDDIRATNYSAGVGDIFGDERGTGWDAYCHNRQLTIELSANAAVSVFSVDGTICLSDATFSAGTHAINLAPGLYIVRVGKSTRRVLVK